MSYHHQLELFLNKVKGRPTQHWISGRDSIRQMRMIDMAYEKNGLGPRPGLGGLVAQVVAVVIARLTGEDEVTQLRRISYGELYTICLLLFSFWSIWSPLTFSQGLGIPVRLVRSVCRVLKGHYFIIRAISSLGTPLFAHVGVRSISSRITVLSALDSIGSKLIMLTLGSRFRGMERFAYTEYNSPTTIATEVGLIYYQYITSILQTSYGIE